ncbi:MAG: glycerol-3-phosphate dehydrogenase [Actinomycetota bacterium]|nr:glycerol-3-phosphate dehydrogenase [Actinomycetota bacterium]
MFDRAAALTTLAGRRFDVLVIGGGITGAGVALDAASRGLSVALVERDDFASGTSSASSKLVHGGLRYVSQGELGLVAQALAERHRLLRNAPHLVRPLPFVLPLGGGAAAARSVGTALWLYDAAGGARLGQVHRRLSVDETRARVPALRADAFRRAYLYLDAHADDARLTLAVVRTAVIDHGAVAANHSAVVGLLRGRTGRVVGARVVADGQEIEVRASVVVNAAGVWSDEVGGLEDDALGAGGRAATIRPAKGVHLTVHRSRLPATSAAVLPVAADGRSIFVIPWPGTDRVYIGTTDTDYQGDVDQARCSAADVAYLLAAVNPSLSEPLTPADVVGCWAGLRPLVAGATGGRGGGGGRTADLSRRHRLSESDRGVVTITGGKLTTYRRMAADTVDRVAAILGAGARSRTATLRLRGAPAAGPGDGPVSASRYGTESGGVQALVAADASLGELLVDGLPYLRAEVVHAVRHEMARTLGDVLDRRLRARILDRDGAAAAASDVAALVGPELGWTRAEADANVVAYRADLDAERAYAGLLGDDRRHRNAG